MPIFFIVLFIIMFKGDRDNWFTSKQFKTIKKVVIAFFLLSLFSSVAPPLLIMSMVASPILIPVLITMLLKKKKKEAAPVESSVYKNDKTGNYYGSDNKKVSSSILPKAASKRRKIIEKFNKKFDLTLTESQIQRIVDASYYSPEWQKEVEDMTKEYDSIYQWYQGETGWLRAYIKVFLVQSISSDFKQQKEICFSEFDQVFAGADTRYATSQDAVISDLNTKFFTEFDEISYMIAYRFLEANGRKYELLNKKILMHESETDILARKYQ